MCKVMRGVLAPVARVGRSFVEPKSTQNLSKLTSTVPESFASSVPDELSQPSWAGSNQLESNDCNSRHLYLKGLADEHC